MSDVAAIGHSSPDSSDAETESKRTEHARAGSEDARHAAKRGFSGADDARGRVSARHARPDYEGGAGQGACSVGHTHARLRLSATRLQTPAKLLVNPYGSTPFQLESQAFHIGSSAPRTAPSTSILSRRARPSTLERKKREREREAAAAAERRAEGEAAQQTGEKRMSDWEMIQASMAQREQKVGTALAGRWLESGSDLVSDSARDWRPRRRPARRPRTTATSRWNILQLDASTQPTSRLRHSESHPLSRGSMLATWTPLPL